MQGLHIPYTGKHSYALRVCENDKCACNVWDCNVCAAINILNLLLSEVNGEDQPMAFCRQTQPTTLINVEESIIDEFITIDDNEFYFMNLEGITYNNPLSSGDFSDFTHIAEV